MGASGSLGGTSYCGLAGQTPKLNDSEIDFRLRNTPREAAKRGPGLWLFPQPPPNQRAEGTSPERASEGTSVAPYPFDKEEPENVRPQAADRQRRHAGALRNRHDRHRRRQPLRQPGAGTELYGKPSARSH